MSALGEEFSALDALLDEHAQLETRMSDPDVLSSPKLLKQVSRRYAELSRIKAAADQLEHAQGDLEAARELAEDDSSFAEEIPALEEAERIAHEHLLSILAPRDPDDACDVILEIKAGEGGEESALFAADLARMYLRYAESQGRVHTSAAGVFVMPELEVDDEIVIDPNDLRIDVYRSSGPGGQSVNTTDSAVRITHLPSGIVVSMQNEKSQLQNKEAALRVLASRLAAEAKAKREAEASAQRLSQVRTVDRSERVRTYNFPENRIADHRSGFKAYNLDQVLDGALDPVIESLQSADEAERLASADAHV